MSPKLENRKFTQKPSIYVDKTYKAEGAQSLVSSLNEANINKNNDRKVGTSQQLKANYYIWALVQGKKT